MVRLMLRRTVVLGREGYEKETPAKEMGPESGGVSLP